MRKPSDGSALVEWVMAARERRLCERFALANRFWWQLPISLSWHEPTGLYVVEDRLAGAVTRAAPCRIMVARPERVLRYRRGVAHRVHKLAAKYFIDRVPLNDSDIVIDCGANVGEIGLHVRSRADVRVIAIEPSTREARACDVNVFDGHAVTHRVALWHCEGEHTFYDSNATGDSSLIAPAQAHIGHTKVRTVRLDALVGEEVEGIQLLKIEGEGAEPEILEGSRGIINRVVHCTIDCGPERGASQAHVIPQVCNFMFGLGFELLDVNLERHIFWFRNRALA